MSDVFISYKQEERERMRPIAAGLRALKVEVWFDERLSPDKPFTEEIEAVANSCRAQLVCWSPAAVKSEWVRGEAEVGRQRGTLVQAMIEPCVLSPPFNVIHAESMADWDGAPQHAGWQKLLDTIGRKIGRPGLAELALIQDSPVADEWKKWAAKFPSDPCADEAWAKAEELHLSAEKDKLKREWQAARKKAEEEEARRRAAEEARRRTPASQPQAHYELPNPAPRRSPAGLIFGAVAAVAVIGAGFYFIPRFLGGGAEALAPGVDSFARDLQGSWRLDGGGDCSAAYLIATADGDLTLTGPDGQRQNAEIQGVEEGWLHARDAEGVSAFYQRRGRVLAFRYGDMNDETSETRFLACS